LAAASLKTGFSVRLVRKIGSGRPISTSKLAT
jgi:hypothetical protein